KFNVLRKAADAASDATDKNKKKDTGKSGKSAGPVSADLSSITAGLGDGLFGQAAEKVGAVSGALEGLRGYLSGLDFQPLKEGLEKVKTGAGAVAEVIKGGLAWGFENILKPLGKWTIEKGLPQVLETFGAGLQTIADAAEAIAPLFEYGWDTLALPTFDILGSFGLGGLEEVEGAFEFISGILSGDEQKRSNGAVSFFNGAVEIAKAWWKGLSWTPFTSLREWAMNTIWNPLGEALFGDGTNMSDMPLFDAALNIGSGILNAIATPFKALGNWAGEHILTPLKNGISAGISFAGEKISVGIELVKSGWDNVGKWISSSWGTISAAAVGLAKKGWTTVSGWIGNIPSLSQMVSLAKSGWSSIKKWIGNIPSVSQAIRLAKSGWVTVGKWVKNSIGSAVNFSIGLAKGWTGSVAKALGLDNLKSKFEIKIPKVSVAWEGTPIALPKFSVKWNAHGGILSGAQLFGMAGNTMLGGGEAGLEAVLPLEQNTRWMDLIFERWQEIQSRSPTHTVAPAENQRPIIVNITTTLDGKVVARNTVNYVRNETRATGVSPLRGAI
ncbi:MAG: hypothetical protein KBS34_03635, partial [Phascolarctobacterium sp.]|nr:hypothetical protein [Candidatus Phascolarctobacterium equi]